MTPPNHPVVRALAFLDVMADDATRLSWTKLGVALSTIFTGVTGYSAMVHQTIGDVATTDWAGFGAAVGLHAITKGAREVQRATEKKP